jgi:hypothetical protein
VLFLTFFGSFTLDAVRYRYSLFHRLASVYFRLDILAKRGFACRFDERHDYLRFVEGVGFIIVVVRMTCTGLAGLAISGRRVVPSLATRSIAARARAGSRLAMAAFSEAIVPDLYMALVNLLAGIYLPFLAGLAVLALSLNALAVGAPLAPGLRIFSPDPAAMRAFLAWILAYSPGFTSNSTFSN